MEITINSITTNTFFRSHPQYASPFFLICLLSVVIVPICLPQKIEFEKLTYCQQWIALHLSVLGVCDQWLPLDGRHVRLSWPHYFLLMPWEWCI